MSIDEQLERLARLRDQGALSEAEFTAAKAKILDVAEGEADAPAGITSDEVEGSAGSTGDAFSQSREPAPESGPADPRPSVDGLRQTGSGVDRGRRRLLAIGLVAAVVVVAIGVVATRSDDGAPNVPTLAGAERSVCSDPQGDQLAERDPGDDWTDLREVRLESDGERLLAIFVMEGSIPSRSSSHSATWKVQLYDGATSTDVAVGATRLFDPEPGHEAWLLYALDATAVFNGMPGESIPGARVTLESSAVIADGNVVSFEVPLSRLPATPPTVEWAATAVQTGEQRVAMDLIANRAYDLCPDAGPPSVNRVISLATNQWDDGGPSESLALGPSPSQNTDSSGSASAGSTRVTSSTAGAGSSAEIEGCPAKPTERIEAEQAARCTYAAYVQSDRQLALLYADPAAVDILFENAWVPPEWEFTGCELEGIDSSTGAACYYFIRDGSHGVQVEMLLGGGPSAGNFIEAVNFYG